MDSGLNDPRLSVGGLVTHTRTALVPHQCPHRVASVGAGGPVVASSALRGEGIFERESTPTVAVQRIFGESEICVCGHLLQAHEDFDGCGVVWGCVCVRFTDADRDAA